MDGVPSVVLGESPAEQKTEKPRYEYNIAISFRCMSDSCKGKILGVGGKGLVAAAIMGRRIDINCPGCGEEISLVAKDKPQENRIVVPGTAPMNREARRRQQRLMR